jgi:hypothetical protein
MSPFAPSHDNALRYAILRVLELLEEGSLVNEAAVASAVGAPLAEVQTQLELLEHDELVRRIRGASGSSRAALTYHRPSLRLIAGRFMCFCAWGKCGTRRADWVA